MKIVLAGYGGFKTTMACSFIEAERQMRRHVTDGMRKREEEAMMKTCHACGQTLPLKVGQVVEYRRVATGKPPCHGIITRVMEDGHFHILAFDGGDAIRHRSALTRLHGYYRITEREAL